MAKKPFFKSLFEREEPKQRIEPVFNPPKPNTPVQYAPQLPTDLLNYGDDVSGMTITSLLGTPNSPSRTRSEIFQQFMLMEKDPIIHTALKTHVIAALGGHESKGDVVFIESEADCTDAERKFVEEIRDDVLELFNAVAPVVAYNGIAFGDAYARTYFKPKQGLLRLISDEMVHPSLVVAYEQGGMTTGFMVGNDKNYLAQMTTLQLQRFKMPRVSWLPQQGVIAKAFRANLLEDDVEKLPHLPSMIGGSFLFAAEKPFQDFYISLNAMVGQRLVDAIDESFITVNVSGSTKEQQKRMAENIRNVLTMSKQMADKAMNGTPFFGRVRHVAFTHNDKQMTLHGDPLSSKRQNSVTIEDIMLHARLLAGALGNDLAMLGFSDQLSGGLGDGGFFRVSAQTAESSRLIRVALADFFNELIDKHCLFKYGKLPYNPKKRPFAVNFYGSISAFEAERQKTRIDMAGSAGMITQALASVKELGFKEKELITFMTKQMSLDEEEAKMYAKAMLNVDDDAGEYDDE